MIPRKSRPIYNVFNSSLTGRHRDKAGDELPKPFWHFTKSSTSDV